MSSQTAVVKQAIKSVGADTQKVPGSNTHTAVWVLGDHELGSEPTDVEYFHVEKTAHKSHPNVTMVTPATSRCAGGHYKTGALFDVWEGWLDVESKFKAVAALCVDNAYYGSKGELKKAKYLPGWFIARRIIQPCIFDHVASPQHGQRCGVDREMQAVVVRYTQANPNSVTP